MGVAPFRTLFPHLRARVRVQHLQFMTFKSEPPIDFVAGHPEGYLVSFCSFVLVKFGWVQFLDFLLEDPWSHGVLVPLWLFHG